MKRWIHFIAVAFAMCFSFASCSDDPKEPLVDKEGQVFLDKGNYVDATISFTDEEFTNRLLARKWLVSNLPYIYDTYNCQHLYLDPSMDYYNLRTYQFYDNNRFDQNGYGADEEGYQFVWSVKDKQFTVSRTYPTGVSFTQTYTVVGISSENIVLDVDYNPELVSIPEGFMSFDESKAKIRYVWEAIYD